MAGNFPGKPSPRTRLTLKSRHIKRSLAALVVVSLFLPGLSGAEDYFDHYGLSPASPTVDIGSQPLGYPSGVISAVMKHDRILRKALADSKQPLKFHPFRRGADMLSLLVERRLEAGLLGDMPTLLAASSAQVWIVGLVKQTSTVIVAKGDAQVRGLVGKRIGYVPASSAHLTLLQGLASAGLLETQVTLVPLSIDDMPDALERGDIDAFAAWEPAPSVALGKSDKNRIVFRGLSSDYFVIERDFAKRAPQTARHVVAGFLRAIEWMDRSHAHVDKAARWAMAEAQVFSGKPESLSVAQIAAITRREILNIPSAPAILSSPGTLPLKNEFEFLMKLGKLPAGAKWQNVETALTYDGLARVMAEARAFQISNFDYEE